MIRNKILIATLLIFCTTFFSCEKEIKLNISNYDKMLVVNSVICPDSLVTVKVSYSQPILENQPTSYINNAEVLLFEESVFLDTLILVADGKYQSEFKPQTNKNYRIQVSDGNRKASAICKIPDKPLITDVDTCTTYDQIGISWAGITIHLSDNGEQKNFYRLFLKGNYGNVSRHNYFGNIVFAYNDEALNNQTSALDAINNYLNDEARNYCRTNLVFSDKSFSGSSREIKLSEIHYGNHTAYVHLHTICEDYYKYLYSYNNRTNNTFSDPYPIYSNIENGLGLFAAYNEVVDSVMF